MNQKDSVCVQRWCVTVLLPSYFRLLLFQRRLPFSCLCQQRGMCAYAVVSLGYNPLSISLTCQTENWDVGSDPVTEAVGKTQIPQQHLFIVRESRQYFILATMLFRPGCPIEIILSTHARIVQWKSFHPKWFFTRLFTYLYRQIPKKFTFIGLKLHNS